MKIAFVSTILEFPWGGADTLWTRAAEEAQARGDSLLLSISPKTAASPRIAALVEGGARLLVRSPDRPFPGMANRIRRKMKSLLASANPLVEELTCWRPDLIIFSCGGTYDLTLEPEWRRWLLESGTPFRIIANWQTECPVLNPDDWDAMRETLGGARDIFFVSTRNLEITRRHLLLPLQNASVLQNPLRPGPVATVPWPATWNLATVSRLDHAKGIHQLLHALALVLKDEADWTLNIYGIGPQEDYLRETTAFLGLDSRVNFRGHVSSLADIWGENCLLVSPAIDDGVPMTIPEAMLCGRPVLATRVGGAEDWISDGVTGFLSDAPALPVLAATLRRCWDSRPQWKRMGEDAAAFAKNHYRANDYKQLIELQA